MDGVQKKAQREWLRNLWKMTKLILDVTLIPPGAVFTNKNITEEKKRNFIIEAHM